MKAKRIKKLQKPSSPGLTAVFIVLLSLMPVLAWLQYEWTGAASRADARQMQDNLRSTAFHFSTDLEQELTIPGDLLMEIFRPDQDLDPNAHRALELVAKIWRENSRAPRVLQRIILGNQDFNPNDPLAQWQTARDIPLSPSSFNFYIPIAPNDGINAMVQLSPQAIVQDLLPQLDEEYFSEKSGLPGYGLRVRDEAGRVIYLSKGLDSLMTQIDIVPDLSLPIVGNRPKLLPRTNQQTRNPALRNWLWRIERRERPPAGLWTLEVFRRDGSLSSTVNRMRWLNLLGSLSLLLVLTLGLIYLYRAYRRNRFLVRRQKDFVASVSHELRTPLAILRGAAENMSEGLIQDPEQAVRYGQTMLTEADRLLALTENTLLWAGFEGKRDMEARLFELGDLCQERFNHWHERFSTAQASLILERSPDSLMIHGNREAISSLIDNLLANALRHGMAGSEKKIAVLVCARAGQELKKTDWLVLEVRDSGPGIAKVDQDLIFEAFYRGRGAQGAGVGLGLNLVRRIARAHSGEVELSSKPGNGANFRVLFPAYQGSVSHE